jgi:O-antigen ligase
VALLALVAVVAWGPGRTIAPEDEGRRMLAASVEAAVGGAERLVPDDTSARGRIEAWSEGLTLLTAHPVFGVGYSRFTEYNELVAHNSFIHTFAELGLLGAFFAMGLAYWYFKGLRVRAAGPAGEADEDPGRQLRLALALSGLGFFTMTSLLSRQYDLVLYTLLGLGACHAAVIQAAAPDGRLATTWRDLRNIALLTGGGIVAIKLVVTVLTLVTRR